VKNRALDGPFVAGNGWLKTEVKADGVGRLPHERRVETAEGAITDALLCDRPNLLGLSFGGLRQSALARRQKYFEWIDPAHIGSDWQDGYGIRSAIIRVVTNDEYRATLVDL
jgi:hypothetical protein